MRRIIASEMMTVDGYFAGPNGEIDWFIVDPEFTEYSIDMLKNADLLIFGRVTYDLMAGYWTSEHAKFTDPIIADRMNTLSKIVFSKNFSSVAWQPTRMLASVVRQTVDNLSSLVRARLTFSKMSDAFAVQIKGFGFSLC